MRSPAPAAAHAEVEVPCNLCGARDAALRFAASRPAGDGEPDWRAFRCTHDGYGIHPPIVACRRCGLIYANPRPPAALLAERYAAVEDPLYVAERRGRELTFRRHLRALERVVGPAAGRRLLDVGAHVGVFVEQASAAGWRAEGLEPSAWCVAEARRRGLRLTPGTLEQASLPPRSFDALTLWDVIEHLDDPLGALRRCRELLVPGGWIAVHTMDAGSLFARLMGRRWPWLMDMHLYYFTRRTLRAMLERAGFGDVRILTQGRYLRLSYLATRLRPYSPLLAALSARLLAATGLAGLAVPVSFGDLMTAYARRLPRADDDGVEAGRDGGANGA
ncbi:MAG: class I SAM-dependent methyltransferase [Acidobacteria bacterium]|nr:MAG: class I SAM-dependent methyltransferase [Acidobacteriota bacterium]